jgi:hypothetical protein
MEIIVPIVRSRAKEDEKKNPTSNHNPWCLEKTR